MGRRGCGVGHGGQRSSDPGLCSSVWCTAGGSSLRARVPAGTVLGLERVSEVTEFV